MLSKRKTERDTVPSSFFYWSVILVLLSTQSWYLQWRCHETEPRDTYKRRRRPQYSWFRSAIIKPKVHGRTRLWREGRSNRSFISLKICCAEREYASFLHEWNIWAQSFWCKRDIKPKVCWCNIFQSYGNEACSREQEFDHPMVKLHVWLIWSPGVPKL